MWVDALLPEPSLFAYAITGINSLPFRLFRAEIIIIIIKKKKKKRISRPPSSLGYTDSRSSFQSEMQLKRTADRGKAIPGKARFIFAAYLHLQFRNHFRLPEFALFI